MSWCTTSARQIPRRCWSSWQEPRSTPSWAGGGRPWRSRHWPRNAGRGGGGRVGPVLEQAGMSGVKVLTLIGTHLVGTALARAERDRGASGARLEEAVFRHLLAARPYGLRNYKEEAARWARWSEQWTATELSAALRAALAADRALKGTTVT